MNWESTRDALWLLFSLLVTFWSAMALVDVIRENTKPGRLRVVAVVAGFVVIAVLAWVLMGAQT